MQLMDQIVEASEYETLKSIYYRGYKTIFCLAYKAVTREERNPLVI